MVLEAKSLKLCSLERLSSGIHSLSLPASGGYRHSLACGCMTNLCLCHHIASSASLYLLLWASISKLLLSFYYEVIRDSVQGPPR